LPRSGNILGTDFSPGSPSRELSRDDGGKVHVRCERVRARLRQGGAPLPVRLPADLLQCASTFSPTVELFILLTGEAGLRVGEVCALKWTDVNFKTNEVHVRRSIVRRKEGPTKSGKERQVPMSKRLRAALQRHQPNKHGGRVLTRDDGSDLTSDDVRHGLERVAKYAGLRVHGPHALRHCFGSRLMLSGAGANVVMELMGHSKLATTQVYVHATQVHCHDAVDRLNR
jgi:integrase